MSSVQSRTSVDFGVFWKLQTIPLSKNATFLLLVFFVGVVTRFNFKQIKSLFWQ